METAPETFAGDEQPPVAPEVKQISILRQTVRYGVHLVAVYAIVWYVTLWLSRWLHGTVLPLILQHPPTVSRFEFAFSHLFALSFYPALLVGFIHSEWFRHRVAIFVWIVPATILAYKFVTFPTSLFQNHFVAAFHEYFAGGFAIPEWDTWEEFFRFVVPNADFIRGMHQHHYTAPLYAAVGYGVGTSLAIHIRIPKLDGAFQRIKPNWRRAKMQ